MRFVLASFVVATAVANEACDQKEQVSMLQTKDRLGLSAKESDVIKAVNEASPMFEGDAQVDQFLDGLKNAIANMKEGDGKEALLQRASQSKQMQELIGRFQSLPEENRAKLTVAGGDILDKLPVSQRSALVQQVSHALDDSTEGKPRTTTDKTPEGKRTVTYNDKTGYYHSHYQGRRGTESASQGKRGGHRHFHSYQHDGQGGNARTATASRGMTGHEHDHSHSHSLNHGVTNTGTSTRSKGSNGHLHQHGHSHTHHPDVGTGTGTFSRTNDDVHTHSHGHNERNGNSDTHSDSLTNGRHTWHHGHHHDVPSGTWVSEGNEGHHNGHWHSGGHHDWDDHDNHDHR